MGMSSEGILFYGIWYSRDEVGEEDYGTKAEDLYYEAKKKECPPPEEDYDVRRGREDPVYDAPWKEYRERVQKWDKQQCKVGYAGFVNYTGNFYVYVVGSKKVAEWDEMVPVCMFAHSYVWDGKLKRFVEDLGLPRKEPGWWLTSYYG